MKEFTTLEKFANLGSPTIAVFTDGRDLTIANDRNGISTSGHWRIGANVDLARFSAVVIYRRDKENAVNYLYRGAVIKTSKSTKLAGRIVLHFKVNLEGLTRSNWKVFARAGSNPVRYWL